MARPRKASGTIGSSEEARAAMKALLLVTVKRERLQGELDANVAAITKGYEGRITEAMDQEKDLALQLQQWYMANAREIEQDGRKSVFLMYGTAGRRQTPPALKLLNKAWTWAACLVRLKEKFGDRYVRQAEPDVNKDLVKAEIPAEELGSYGLRLDQDEKFFVELDRTQVEVL